MTDFADDANMRAEQFLGVAMSNARGPRLVPTGFCLYCAEGCESRLFCGPECRDDYEHETRAKEIRGRPG